MVPNRAAEDQPLLVLIKIRILVDEIGHPRDPFVGPDMARIRYAGHQPILCRSQDWDRGLCQGDNGTFPASWTANLLARFWGESDEHRTTISRAAGSGGPLVAHVLTVFDCLVSPSGFEPETY